MITELNQRSREIFRLIVDAYVATGEPVGSRTISRRLGMALSPATIRNVMADLEEQGLLYAPHTSAGRIPTEAGLRLFVNGLLEIGSLTEDERESIEAKVSSSGRSLQDVMREASGMLSGLSHCAGLVLAPKTDRPLKHIEFVSLAPGRALVVLVNEDGLVENRVIEVPVGVPASTLQMVSNFLSAKLVGRTLDEARQAVLREIEEQKTELDELSRRVVAAGLATWAGSSSQDGGHLIVRGQAKLLEDVTALSDLERVRSLFEALETKETMLRLLDATGQGDGVQIFIGAENVLFNHSGCSLIISPFQNSREQVIGAIGVIGPTRINYARIIPLVDYTAKVISRLVG
ncbi:MULTISPECIES: heat-inducible transcriptional repressor HrcA [Azospirillum]|uniref:Heat-inducible transcription repressor HrcA n=1 Tax=Azospirillum rugosum TaxID=416170 RepID=A0ABS4SPC5_9PROT|nr:MULTISPECIES: heat-inducible transcriptional repressor HrcA [Azospirillum]MBP2293948.1 heat-inducible transcriptional repressor [Azospirillum rugosum]MCW2235464.1 heat-inducible transcriptional repressor [Azospirillum canadense]MDQ0526865.1 heat-inducible transcriptional repressor [Azospirillum rugosum]